MHVTICKLVEKNAWAREAGQHKTSVETLLGGPASSGFSDYEGGYEHQGEREGECARTSGTTQESRHTTRCAGRRGWIGVSNLVRSAQTCVNFPSGVLSAVLTFTWREGSEYETLSVATTRFSDGGEGVPKEDVQYTLS